MCIAAPDDFPKNQKHDFGVSSCVLLREMVFGDASGSATSHLDPVFQAQEHCRELHATLKTLIQEGGKLSEQIHEANAAHQVLGSDAQDLQQRLASADVEALLVRLELEGSQERSITMKNHLDRLLQSLAGLEKDHFRCTWDPYVFAPSACDQLDMTALVSEVQSKAKRTQLHVDGMHEEFKATMQKTRREIRELEARIAETSQQKEIAASFNDRIEKKAVENTKLGVALSDVEKLIKEVSIELHLKEAELDWIVADHDEIMAAKQKDLDCRDAECAYLGGQVESLEEQMNELTERERTTAMVTESLRERLKRLERP